MKEMCNMVYAMPDEIKDGKIANQSVGVKSKEAILDMI